MKQLLQNETENSHQKSITKCDRGLLQSALGITKCDRLLLQRASGIKKCDITHILPKVLTLLLMFSFLPDQSLRYKDSGIF